MADVIERGLPQELAVELAALNTVQGSPDRQLAEREAEHRRRAEELRQQARSAVRAFDAWPTVRSDEEWLGVVEQANRDYDDGRFLLERLGGERFLDPVAMATIWSLRQRLLQDFAVQQAHEYMLVDVLMLSYHRLLHLNTVVGDLALHVEHQLFGLDAPSVKIKEVHGRQVAAGLDVEGLIDRLGQQLLPLMDRCHRMMTRALHSLQEARRTSTPMPSVAIGQMNVGGVQANSALVAPQQVPADPLRPSTATGARRGFAPSSPTELGPSAIQQRPTARRTRAGS